MSFTNLKYDGCQQAQQVRESIGPGHYMINTPNNNPDCKPCFYTDPKIRLQRVPLRTGETQPASNNIKVDVESEMFGITRNATKCPTAQYLPQSSDEINSLLYTNQLAESCHLHTEDSRLNNPPATLRGTGIDRFEWLCKDPQQNTEISFDYVINTRILSKDTHRPYIQQPMDQSMFQPTPKKGICGKYDIRLCPQPIGNMKAYTKPNDLSEQYKVNFKNSTTSYSSD